MQILPFSPKHESGVLDLIVGIQRDEFAIDIDAERQPDLRAIPSFYQIASGNFWVAVENGDVVGTIALLDIGNQQCALRKMFVDKRFRGSEFNTASRLLDTFVDWASTHRLREVFLGTTSAFLAAHRFYEKRGFDEISRFELPTAFPLMEVDSKFYMRTLPERTSG